MFVYAVNATHMDKIAPTLLHKSLMAFVGFGVSLLWYFAICDGAIAIYRLAVSRFKNQRDPKVLISCVIGHVVFGQFQLSDECCQLNRSLQHHPAH